MVYDYLSQKTDEDVLKMKTISEVHEFRRSLDEQINALNIIRAKFGQLTKNQSVKYAALKCLTKVCNNRVKELALKSGRYKVNVKIKASTELIERRRLEAVFMSVAKEVLSKEMYKEILEIAKERIDEIK